MTAVEVPPCDDPEVSILLLGFRHEGISDAVAAVVAGTGPDVAYEVLVLLNGASEQVRAEVASIGGARVVDGAVNAGFAGGMNTLAREARGRYLAFLNDDARPHAGWLAALLAVARDPEVGLVSGRLLFPDGRLQEAGGRILRGGEVYQVGWGAPADADPALLQERDVDYGSAAASVMDRALFESLGGFDEIYYPAYFEDVDLSLRIRKAGRRIVYVPDAVVTHLQWGSTTPPERDTAHRFAKQFFDARWAALYPRAPRREDPLPVLLELAADVPAVGFSAQPWPISLQAWQSWLTTTIVRTQEAADQAAAEVEAVSRELPWLRSRVADLDAQLQAADARAAEQAAESERWWREAERLRADRDHARSHAAGMQAQLDRFRTWTGHRAVRRLAEPVVRRIRAARRDL